MKEYLFIGLAIIIILAIIYVLIKCSNKFRKLAYKMFLFAEHEVIKGRKMDYVVNEIYELLPAIFRVIPKSAYKKLLQNMFDEIKDLLDDGKINKKKESE